MSERVEAIVQTRQGNRSRCSIEIRAHLDRDRWELEIEDAGLETSRFEAGDIFEAMVSLRLELERQGAMLLCQGARPNVFPSGMSRSMGGGRRAYEHVLGQPATGDLIDIFDYAAPESVGTVADQTAFKARWVEALRNIARQGANDV